MTQLYIIIMTAARDVTTKKTKKKTGDVLDHVILWCCVTSHCVASAFADSGAGTNGPI